MLSKAPENEAVLRDYAAREGVSIDDLIARAFPPIPPTAPVVRVHDLLAKWQAIDGTRRAEPAANDGSLTPSGALFREWDEEDSHLTEEERLAEEKLWQEFKDGINAERVNAGMRLIF